VPDTALPFRRRAHKTTRPPAHRTMDRGTRIGDRLSLTEYDEPIMNRRVLLPPKSVRTESRTSGQTSSKGNKKRCTDVENLCHRLVQGLPDEPRLFPARPQPFLAGKLQCLRSNADAKLPGTTVQSVTQPRPSCPSPKRPEATFVGRARSARLRLLPSEERQSFQCARQTPQGRRILPCALS